ncbi:hypothetical protein VCHC55C2_1224B, partial [Vibrio cholerae HC-55C2]
RMRIIWSEIAKKS